MELDLHVSRFDWAGSPANIGPGVADLARRAEAIGVRTMSLHKLDVLRRHCEAIGRDPNEIDVTAMYRDIPPDATVEQLVRGAEELAQIGVSGLVTGVVGSDPGGWLESTFGPAMEEIRAIKPTQL